ncbi:MAG: DUF1934 domain-containing protein [Brevibacillus sp.]|nr:DUF1934 domain-containing protein [Brevibacillus sp.]
MQDVVLTLSIKQMFNGQEEEVKQQYRTRGVSKQAGWYFSYTEPIAEVGEVQTVVKIGDDEVTILRQGPLAMKQRFQAGTSTECTYHSPYGRFRMAVHTRKLRLEREHQRPVRLDIYYQLWLDDAYAGEFELHFRFDWQ